MSHLIIFYTNPPSPWASDILFKWPLCYHRRDRCGKMKFGEDEKFGDKDGSDQEIEKDKGKR